MNSNNNIILIKTLQLNELPFPFKGTVISIVGQDFVFKTTDGNIFKLPFAAQFSGLTDDAFEVRFSDGTQINSKELINKAIDNLAKNDEYISTHPGDNVQPDNHEHQKVITKTVYEKVEVPIHDNNNNSSVDQNAGTISQVNEDNDGTDNGDNLNIAAPEQVIFFTSSSSTTSPQSEPPVVIPPVQGQINVSLLQLDTLIDYDNHTVEVGGGDRNDSSYELQYGVKTVDLSDSNDNWTINAQIRGSSDNENTLTKIIRLDDVTTITGISANQSSDYNIISWDSTQGQDLGLKQNEFAIVYSTSNNDSFSVNVNFSPPDANGNTSYNMGFDITSDPLSVEDANGGTLLGTSPAPLIIKGGSGDDTIIAGKGNDIYDGGGGNNSIDYSQLKHGITVDYQADNKNTLDSVGINDNDSAKVTGDDISTQQVINNVQIITGTNFDDVFITDTGNHIFHGGAGNDTFISYGGNNTFDGGSGSNTVDYRNVGGKTFGQVKLGDGITVDLNGVEVNLADNETINNGWTDSNGVSGKDQLTNIHTVYGTSYNDLIICDDNNNTIYCIDGDNVVVSGNGNNVIDGGKGTTAVDYSKINGIVDVDLNAGMADKANGTEDNLTNVSTVIGSADGGTLTGKTGASNTLIGTGGNTSYILNGGTNTVLGGTGNNTYNVVNSIITLTGDGASNIGYFNNDILNYHGSENGSDQLVIEGGLNSIFIGGGYSDITFGGSSYNDIHTSGGGTFVYHGGNSYSELYLDDQTNVTLDYSKVDDNGFSADLNNGVIISSSGNFSDRIYSGTVNSIIGTSSGNGQYNASGYTTDLSVHAFGSSNTITMGSGNKNSVIIDKSSTGESANNNIITANGTENNFLITTDGSGNKITIGAKSDVNNVEITGSASNNTIYVKGGSHNSIIFDNAVSNNCVDYSATTGVLNIDLNQDSASSNGSGGSDQLIGVDYIVGNSAKNSTFHAKEGVNTTFNISKATYATLLATNTGNDTYLIKDGNSSINYSNLDHSVKFQINGQTATTVSKGSNYSDAITGYVGSYTGTNFGDSYSINAFSGLKVDGGAGNDNFTVLSINKATGVVIDGHGGNNSFTFHGSQASAMYVTFSSASNGFNMHLSYKGYDAKDSSGYMDAKNMDILHFSNATDSALKWSGTNGITVVIDQHYAGHYYRLDVNGGGNYIDGGATGLSLSSPTFVRYDVDANMAHVSINANLSTGVVSFSDGRANDTLINVNKIEGTSSDDIIIGHNNMSDGFVESNGNDQIDGNSNSGNVYYTTAGNIVADFNTGQIVKAASDGTAKGTDTISNIQEIDLEGLSGTNHITAKDNTAMTFKLDSNAIYYINGAHNANDTFSQTSGTLHMDYASFTNAMNVDLDSNKVSKGDGSTDNFGSHHIDYLTTGSGNDVFSWSKFSDVTTVHIDGGSGSNELQEKAGGDIAVNLGTLSNVSNIQTVDLSNVTHSSITFDVNGFFNAHTTQNDLTIKIQDRDSSVITLTDHDGWVEQTTGTTDNYTDTHGHALHIEHVTTAA